MTTKYITTYVAAGYTLAAKYNTLIITSTGGVGGTGVSCAHVATIINDGRIEGSTNGVYLAEGLLQNGAVDETAAFIQGTVYGYNNLSIVNYGTIEGRVGCDYDDNIVNHGTIDGAVSGYGGLITNGSASDTSAIISGRVGFREYGTVQNFGILSGGAYLSRYGTIVNGGVGDVSATIAGGIRTANNNFRDSGSVIINYGTVEGPTSGSAQGGISLTARDVGLTNGSSDDARALIRGATYGVQSYYSGVVNYGSIVGKSGAGVSISYAGVYNGTSAHSKATIKGVIGVFEPTEERFDDVRVNNAGTIEGAARNGVGVEFEANGQLLNGSRQNHTALVEGYSGLNMKFGFNCVNYGTILGEGSSGGYGVAGAGTLTNGAAGFVKALISGFTGVTFQGTYGKVTNFGTLEGTGGTAFAFTSAGGTLVVENGCKFIGAVEGDGGTLDLDTGTGAVTGLPGEGAIVVNGIMAATTFSSFAILEIGHYAHFKSRGSGSVAAGQTISDAGLLTLGGGKTAKIDNGGLIETTGAGLLTLAGEVSNSGTISALGGTLTLSGEITGGGMATVDAATLDFSQGSSQNVTFTGASGVLVLAQSQAYAGAVAGFSYTGGTSLDLEDISYTGGKQASYSGNNQGGVLTVTDGTHTAHIAFTGNYRAAQFVVSSDGQGGVVVVDPTTPATPSTHPLVQAMASLGAAVGGEAHVREFWKAPTSTLASPRVEVA
jgi:hypothetical protein